MLVAPIPPVTEFVNNPKPHGHFHLALSHLFDSHPEYLRYFIERRKAGMGDYVVLDNGAHENKTGEPISKLLELAVLIDADEIVLPDVLDDYIGTVEATATALDQIEQNLELAKNFLDKKGRRIMLVPQGKDYDEWRRCLEKLLQLYDFMVRSQDLSAEIPVIGVSKDYDDVFPGGLHQAFLGELEGLRDEVDVHCLGWPRDLWNFGRLLHDFPWIRSTDSARAYVYALAGVRLELGAPYPEYPKRPSDYFSHQMTPEERLLAQLNLEEYFKVTQGLFV